jgi:hypothetical protein
VTPLRFAIACGSALAGLAVGLLGAAGCVVDDCDCPEATPIQEGTFPVTSARSVPEGVGAFDPRGATVSVAPGIVLIEYSRGNARITARYLVTNAN